MGLDLLKLLRLGEKKERKKRKVKRRAMDSNNEPSVAPALKCPGGHSQMYGSGRKYN